MARPIRHRLTGPLAQGLVLLALVGCTARSAIPPDTRSVTISRLASEPLGVRTTPEVELVAAFELESDDPRFGGFSGIAVDGERLWLLSDRATLWQAELDFDEASGTLGLDGWRAGTIAPDAGDRTALDSEALALAADGAPVAGFEQDGSVRRLEPDGSGGWTTRRLHDGPLFPDEPANRGLEALTELGTTAFLALSEGARTGVDLARGVRLEARRAADLTFRTTPGFSPVGAALASGWVLVLERSVGLLTGWQTRVTAIPLEAVEGADPSAPLAGAELLRIGAGPLAENYEGIAGLAAADGSRSVLLIADDNQSALQRTLLLVFRWRDS